MAGNIYQFYGTPSNNKLESSTDYTSNWTYQPRAGPFWINQAESMNGGQCLPFNGQLQPNGFELTREVPMNNFSGNEVPLPSDSAPFLGTNDSGMSFRRRNFCQKRRSTDSLGPSASKCRRTDEHMAAEMSGLSIDLNQNNRQSLSIIDDDDMTEEVTSLRPINDVRWELSDVLKNTLAKSKEEPLLPQCIAEKILNPCTDLVLWSPPTTIIQDRTPTATVDSSTECSDSDQESSCSSIEIPVWSKRTSASSNGMPVSTNAQSLPDDDDDDMEL